MCGRAAVIRAGHGLARAVGARRIIHDKRSANPAFAPKKGGAGGGVGGATAGFFHDAGQVAPRVDAADVNAAPAGQSQAHDSAAAAADSSPTKAPKTIDDVQRVKTEDEPQQASSKGAQTHQQTSQTDGSTTTRPAYFNANCGPTSTVPVWRLQTAAEQSELLKLEHALEGEDASKSVVKQEVDELAADAVKAESEHKQVQSVSVLQYMQWGFDNPFAGRMTDSGPSRSHVFNARSETIDEKRMFSGLVEKKRCIVLGQWSTHTRRGREGSAYELCARLNASHRPHRNLFF
jgi:hypothetical protein